MANRKKPEDMRVAKLLVAMTADERAKCDQAAQDEHMNLSNWVRRTLILEAERVEQRRRKG